MKAEPFNCRKAEGAEVVLACRERRRKIVSADRYVATPGGVASGRGGAEGKC
jgi:hypothetical protein